MNIASQEYITQLSVGLGYDYISWI
jgi:hypothetical protein